MRRFGSLVLSEVPNAVLCLCAQGENAFLRIAPQRFKSNEPPAKGHRGPSTVSTINGEPKGSHVKQASGKLRKAALRSCFADTMSRCRRKLLVKSAERSAKWCHSSDDGTGDNAMQRLSILPSARRAKGSFAERMRHPPLVAMEY